MIKLDIVDYTHDHILLAVDEPVRFEVSLIGHPPRIIVHGYRGVEIDLDQGPDIVYDGTEAHEMRSITR